MRRAASAVAALTSERYPHLRRGPFGRLTDTVLSRFSSAFDSNRLVTDPQELIGYNVDWIKTCRGASPLVIRPKNTEELSAALRICSEERLAVVPQGGNTGLVGGSVPVFDEVIISTTSMNQIYEIDELSGSVECDAGCVLESLDAALAPKGLMMPLDLGAKGSCQIGGNVATSAGGLRLLRYGPLQATTLGLEVVLIDGTILDLKSKLKKDNTGYHLKQLFIGSEGTLGIISKVVISTPVRPKSVSMSFLVSNSFDSVLRLFTLAKSTLGEILSSFELMDRPSLESVDEVLGVKSPFPGHEFSLIVETHGSDPGHDLEKMTAFVDAAMSSGLVQDGIVADEPSKMVKLWEVRERITESMSRRHYVFKYDVTLPLPKLHQCVVDVRSRLKNFPDLLVTGFGHVGDGNLHLNIRAPEYSPELEAAIEPFIFEWVSANKGSISAEHGIGFKKSQFLHYSKSEPAIELMRQIKSVFDPIGLLNPYKVLPNRT